MCLSGVEEEYNVRGRGSLQRSNFLNWGPSANYVTVGALLFLTALFFFPLPFRDGMLSFWSRARGERFYNLPFAFLLS